ncbi:unnamed protein product [Dicrocoelium dendriticum]|nr:unnamed protein product [Dicrocoelium dendriticum]
MNLNKQSGVSYASSSACGAHGSTPCGKSLHGIHKTFAADIRPIELCSRSSSHPAALMSAGVSDAGDCWCLHPNQIPIDYSEHPCRPTAEENRCTENLRPITPHLESSLHRRISYEDQRARRSSRHRKLSSHSRRMSTTECYTKIGQSLAVSKGPVQAGRSNRSRAENTDVMPHRKNSRQESNHAARLSQHETASLIQVIESLRESIETSNARLEIELNSVEPVSSVRMRKQALAISTNTSYHRTSIAINRGSRFKFPKHDTARRTPFHRRADEPGQNRSEKVSVEVRVVFLKIGEIDTLKEYYYADAFIQAKWREPKLDGRTVDEPTVTELEQFWNPQIYIDNILSETKETQWLVAQKNEAGEMYLVERRRIKGVFLETLELNDFPLDVQVSEEVCETLYTKFIHCKST